MGLQIIVIVLLFLFLWDVYDAYRVHFFDDLKFYTTDLFTVKGFFVTETPIIIAFLLANYIKNYCIKKVAIKTKKKAIIIETITAFFKRDACFSKLFVSFE